MNEQLLDFIQGISEFSDCNFCKKFGFSEKCPVKNFYENDNEPSPEQIQDGSNLCKSYIYKNLKAIL